MQVRLEKDVEGTFRVVIRHRRDSGLKNRIVGQLDIAEVRALVEEEGLAEKARRDAARAARDEV